MISIAVLRAEINNRLDQVERLENAFNNSLDLSRAGVTRAIRKEAGRKPLTPTRRKSMAAQGAYLGMLRPLKKTDPVRLKAKAIANKDGVEKALAYLRSKKR